MTNTNTNTNTTPSTTRSTIRVEDAREAIANGRAAALDVLPPEVFAQRHLPQAKNACVYEVAFPETAARALPAKDQRVVVYGAGDRFRAAEVAAERLRGLGYADVVVLEGGLERWVEAGLPLEGEEPTCTVAPVAPVEIADGEYALDVDASRIDWSGRNPKSQHMGTLRFASGRLRASGSALEGQLLIDMRSIACTDLEGDLARQLEAHLASDDFFATDRFPTAALNVTGAARRSDATPTRPGYDIAAALIVRGLSVDVSLSATLTPLGDGGYSVCGGLDLDRTRVGSVYGSAGYFEHLGMHLVHDLVRIDARAVLRPA